MIIRNKNIANRRRRVPHLLFFIFYSVFIYATVNLYKDNLFKLSLKLMTELNEKKTVNNKFLPYFERIATICGSYNIYFINIFILYNFVNIFKVLILIISISSAELIGAMLKIIYHQPLMYYSQETIIEPIRCNCGWGLPSVYSVTSTCFYLTLWEIIFYSRLLKHKKKLKFFCLIISFLIILFVNFCEFAAGLHSIDQIIFGMLVGFQIYYFIFYVLQLDMNNGKWLFKLINMKFVFILIINLLIFLTFLLLFLYVGPDDATLNNYITIIENSFCNKAEYRHSIHPNLRFSRESLIHAILFSVNIPIILAIFFEFKFQFNSNEQLWRDYNFEKEKDEEESFLSRYSLAKYKLTQWNHTKFYISIVRIIIAAALHAILLAPYYLIYFDDSYLVVIFLKIILSIWLNFFFMFYFEKIILMKLFLTNDQIYKSLRENLLTKTP